MNESSNRRILRSTNTAFSRHIMNISEVMVESTPCTQITKRCGKELLDVCKTGSERDEFETLLDDNYEIVQVDNNKIVQEDYETVLDDSDPQNAKEFESEFLQYSPLSLIPSKEKCDVNLGRIRKLKQTCVSQRLKIKRLHAKIKRQNEKMDMFIQIIQDLQNRRNRYL